MRKPITQKAKSPLKQTDEVTLGRSILARIPFEASISKS